MTRDFVLRVRLNEEERKALESHAQTSRLSVAEAVRDWVRGLVKKSSASRKRAQ